jgi:hypothetical protein
MLKSANFFVGASQIHMVEHLHNIEHTLRLIEIGLQKDLSMTIDTLSTTIDFDDWLLAMTNDTSEWNY